MALQAGTFRVQIIEDDQAPVTDQAILDAIAADASDTAKLVRTQGDEPLAERTLSARAGGRVVTKGVETLHAEALAAVTETEQLVALGAVQHVYPTRAAATADVGNVANGQYALVGDWDGSTQVVQTIAESWVEQFEIKFSTPSGYPAPSSADALRLLRGNAAGTAFETLDLADALAPAGVTQRGDMVAVPALFGWTPPAAIYHGWDGRFRVAPDFSVRGHANIAVASTAYVNTVTGDDADSGLRYDLPKRTLSAAVATGADRVVIQDGSYIMRSEVGSAPARDMEFIGQGTVYWTADRGESVGAYALSAGKSVTYEAAVSGGQSIARVYDETNRTPQGDATEYAPAADAAAVEATPGSYFMDTPGGTLYVHALSGADPSALTLRHYDSSALYASRDNVSYYFENIIFRGGLTMQSSTATGGAKLYMSRCIGHFLVLVGVEEAILERLTLANTSEDCANYDVRNGIPPRVMEIDCTFRDSGVAGNNQGSTAHNECYVVSVQTHCLRNAGQGFADAGAAARRWALGCLSEASQLAETSFYTEGKLLAHGCRGKGNSTDFQGSGNIYVRGSFEGDGVNSVSGTLIGY